MLIRQRLVNSFRPKNLKKSGESLSQKDEAA